MAGPRPERVEYVEMYSTQIPEWHFREKVRGRMTGYAQAFGKYSMDAQDMLFLYSLYLEEYSYLLKRELLMMTSRVLFSKEAVEGF